ncbi:MAG: YbjQ family protein [Proteobacteria bacterium]|nr:YbjQ family protein [Pseudomonadota bacterium]MBU1612320.1 YbjQ family protein [Pseudomonadota bacterium]
MFLLALAIGLIVGSWIERRHYRSIIQREQAGVGLPVVSIGKKGETRKAVQEVRLVVGMASISTDFFKRLMGSIISIFGGEIRAYESLVDRARREALLRMREQAKGADLLVNVRVENSNLFISAGQRYAIGSVEVMAYGTAITYEK